MDRTKSDIFFFSENEYEKVKRSMWQNKSRLLNKRANHLLVKSSRHWSLSNFFLFLCFLYKKNTCCFLVFVVFIFYWEEDITILHRLNAALSSVGGVRCLIYLCSRIPNFVLPKNTKNNFAVNTSGPLGLRIHIGCSSLKNKHFQCYFSIRNYLPEMDFGNTWMYVTIQKKTSVVSQRRKTAVSF